MIFLITFTKKNIISCIIKTFIITHTLITSNLIILLYLILRKLGILEMVLCIQAIVIGVCGGAVSFYTAIKYIQ